MLIDRFRFDSFQPGRVRAEDSTLLTRFGSKLFLFFLVTPPSATVERAWTRGVETGRFKAVDDLLYHNIEAYTGMPDLFFNWAGVREKSVHYEFLDNSVDRGERPRSIAYGQNGSLTVVDYEKFCDIVRFQNVNVDAAGPDEIEDEAPSLYQSAAILRRAMKEMKTVDVLVPGQDIVFAQSNAGIVTVDIDRMPKGFDPDVFGEFEETNGPIQTQQFAGIENTIGAFLTK